MDLKARLKQLAQGSIERKDVALLLPDMIDHIGAPDPELRDNLIYQTFIRIIDENLLTKEQFRHMLNTCLDEHHLSFRLGERETDSVFTRSFSSLVIAGLLTKDSEIGLLSEEEIQETFDRCISYLKFEQDTRGFVEEKGWAHSIAHGADLLVSLVNHPTCNKKNYTVVLDTIHNCLLKEATYIDDEDERLVFVTKALIEQGVNEGELEKWVLDVFNDLEKIHEKEGFSLKYFRVKFNISTFMKTCYFQLGFKEYRNSIRAIIQDNLKELHLKLYGA
ncbi:DUF2785 domain-containing protein [Oceanobacillus manasiensis]|uniref:DUF2785 domain-containing protein n=1 Tax=Oceanobacillus manasiensis TaxID=586413 RepID=UPI0006946265|nr:DUF2785 domain-containing protein [Oceanobacillus manasiensis]